MIGEAIEPTHTEDQPDRYKLFARSVPKASFSKLLAMAFFVARLMMTSLFQLSLN